VTLTFRIWAAVAGVMSSSVISARSRLLRVTVWDMLSESRYQSRSPLPTCPMNRPGGYIDVDSLQAETSLEAAAAKCGIPLDVKGSGAEVRIDCPFGCAGDHCGRKEVAINTENPQKVFQCHAYQCQFRGNLLTLMHGWLAGKKPAGDKLKGEEFQRVKRVLAGTGDPVASGQQQKQPTVAVEAATPHRRRTYRSSTPQKNASANSTTLM